MYKNTASQKVIVFAYDATANTPKTGDAAQITAYVSKDYGAVTALTDTSATEMDATNAPGYYLFDISQTETNADTLLISGKSSTANVKVLGSPATIFTRPPNFSAASIDSNGRVDVIKVAGTTQTARDLGASVLLSSGTGTGQVSLSSGLVRLSSTGVADIVTTALTESYNTDGSAATLTQLLYLIAQRLTEFSISGTTITVKKLDGTTTAATLTLDDATSPTSSTRAT